MADAIAPLKKLKRSKLTGSAVNELIEAECYSDVANILQKTNFNIELLEQRNF